MPRLAFSNGVCIPIPQFNSRRFSVGPFVVVSPLEPHDVSESSKGILIYVIVIVGITHFTLSFHWEGLGFSGEVSLTVQREITEFLFQS